MLLSLSALALVASLIPRASAIYCSFDWCKDFCTSAGAWICDYGGPTENGGRRLTETGVSGVVLKEHDWQEYQRQCADFDYDLGLLVDHHLMLVAMPGTEAKHAGGGDLCNTPVVMHAKVSQDGSQKKEVIAAVGSAFDNENQDLLSGWMYGELDHVQEASLRDNTIALGTFVLNDIVYAYDHAEENADELLMDHTKYDIVMNNCGVFIKNFAAVLGIDESADKVQNVAETLLKHGGESLVGMIRASNHLSVLMDETEETVPDLELVRRLVARAPN